MLRFDKFISIIFGFVFPFLLILSLMGIGLFDLDLLNSFLFYLKDLIDLLSTGYILIFSFVFTGK